jgi:esterase/lipase superfamily enzyme
LLRRIAILSLCLLAACGSRGTITVVPPETVPGPVEEIFVGTSRGLDTGGVYGGIRSESMSFARYDIAIPPVREVGTITWPSRPERADVTTDFLTTAQVLYPSQGDFRAGLSRSLRQTGGSAVIFVHGFNNTFSEGLYRLAQLTHDLQIEETPVHYSWPSIAQPLGYVADRDSALFARDGLETLIREVRAAGARRIVLVAHSMGSFITMETLRQIAIRGDTSLLRTIDGVVLMSPDIDVDVFRMQAKAIGDLPDPFIIFGSPRDSVLRLSSLITGQTEGRLGALDDVEKLADLDVTYLDVGAFRDGTRHFTAGTSAGLIRIIGRIEDVDVAFGRDRAARTGLLPGVVLTVRRATRIILEPVGVITGQRLN